MTEAKDKICLKRLDKSERRWVYNEWMTRQFPRDELKPLRSIEKCVRKGIYEGWGMWIGDELTAYAMLGFSAEGGLVLLDYYGVKPELKGRGHGSVFLKRLTEEAYAGWKAILIESENPDFIDDSDDKQIAFRRLDFYSRNGCEDTGIRVNLFGVEFNVLILSVSEHPKDAESILNGYSDIYRGFLSQVFFSKFVHARIEK